MTARSRGKVKPRPCPQEDTCPKWSKCPYKHDSDLCRRSFGQDSDDIELID